MLFASKMDALVRERLYENSVIYKRSLDRIADKYSKLQYQDEGLEVDLNNINSKKLERYMRLSKKVLNKLESKSLTDLQGESITVQDITGSSRLDLTCQDGGTDECDKSVSTCQFYCDDGVARSEMTQLTVSSLDESEQKFSEAEIQPEDQDEELEMTLRSHGSSLSELYPSMINRIERAWHRLNVSEAADSVRRRYQRWRQQLNRSNLNSTFNVTLRHASRNPRKMSSKMQHKQSSSSLQERQVRGSECAPRSPLQITTNLQALQVQHPSPERQRGSLRREQLQPIITMDLSGQCETSKPKDVSLNKTFTLSELPYLPCTYPASPSRPCYPTARASSDVSLRSKRLSLSGHSEESNRSSVYTSHVTAVKERPGIYGSPVRQSPIKARMMSNLSRSPQVFSRSPKSYTVESFYSREPTRPSTMSPSLSSSSQRSAVPLRRIYPQDSNLSPQPRMHSPQPATAGRPKLRRHLSFDSSLPSMSIAFSPKKLDEDFVKLYHKFVCQSKSSSFNDLPCRLCAKRPGVIRSHSSSALAALALSPHRAVLRKRHRELGWDGHPQSKRSRVDSCASSPGSKRHGNEMLRRCLLSSKFSQNDLTDGSSKHSLFYKFSNQQTAASAQQGAASAAEFSGLGGSLESSFANGHSPRKW